MMAVHKPLVSVIIPVYNGDRYISQAIESILCQTYANYEIIIIDDGSTDGTRNCLEPYWHKIRYFYQDNQGVATARNRGISESEGNLIAFLDQDDFFVPDKLELQVACWQTHLALGIVNSGWRVVDREGKAIADLSLWQHLPHLNLEAWMVWKPVLLGAMLFEREWLARAGGFDTRLHQASDVDLVLRLVVAGCQSAWVERSTVCYRQHELNASRDVLTQARELEIVLDRLFSYPNLTHEIRELEGRSRYQTLVWSAAKLYHHDRESDMVNYLEKSMSYSPYHLTEMVLDWLHQFRNYSLEYGRELDVYALSRSRGWMKLMNSILFTSQTFAQI
jgi:glycosyltransferase involved in cell wall biosynthesis